MSNNWKDESFITKRKKNIINLNSKQIGKKHPRWDDKKSDKERISFRCFAETKIWRKSVYERDNYTCQICGDSKGGNLNAHHLDGWDWCREKRFDINNGVTLCIKCHKTFHSQYGYGNNTKEQFLVFLEVYKNESRR